MRVGALVFVAVALAACSGATEASPIPGPVPIPGVASVELTEPWKSMNLPIEGAIVEASTESGLLVRFPSVAEADAGPTLAALEQALVDGGWAVDRASAGPPEWRSVLSRDEQVVSMRVFNEGGRPSASLTLR